MHNLPCLMLAPFAASGLATVGAVWLAASVESNAFALGVLAISILAAAGLARAIAGCWRMAKDSEKHLEDKGDSIHG